MQEKLFQLQPNLSGSLISLRPLRLDDFDELFKSASDPLIWEQHPQKDRYQRDVFLKFFNGAIESKGALVVVDLVTGGVIGSSRFYDLNPGLGQITVGYTFLAKKYWGGKFNRQLKMLMLEHAFQFVNSVRFEIGEENLRSRRAIEKIGARLMNSEKLDGKAYVVYSIDSHQFRDAL